MKIMLLKRKELAVGYSPAHARGFSGLAGPLRSVTLCLPLFCKSQARADKSQWHKRSLTHTYSASKM